MEHLVSFKAYECVSVAIRQSDLRIPNAGQAFRSGSSERRRCEAQNEESVE